MCNSNILIVDDAQQATILAALRYYQQEGMGDPANRSDDIHEIATCGDTVMSSLDDEGIDELCEAINLKPSTPDYNEVLALLKEQGMGFSDCIKAFAADKNDVYVEAAESVCDGIEIDEITVVSKGEEPIDGAYVLGWVWVSNEDAGIKCPSQVLATVHELACKRLEHVAKCPADEAMQANCSRHQAYADWLEQLITNFADEIDELAGTSIGDNLPSPIDWAGEGGQSISFMPSDALLRLIGVARLAGLSDDDYERANAFMRDQGNKLDAVLKTFRAA